MENLQKVAEAVHADFVAESLKQLEATAWQGKFNHSITGTFEELRALANELRRNGYEYELEQGINKAYLTVQWHTAL